MCPLSVHVYVDPGIDDAIHVYIHRDGTTDVITDDELGPSEQTTSDADAIEAIFKRFDNYDPEARTREIAVMLEALGYTAHAPKHRANSQTRSAYIRWIYQGAARKVSLYQNTGALVFDRDRDRALMASQPGADVRGEKQRVHFFTQDEDGPLPELIDQAIAAAAALRDDADRA